MTIGRKLVYVAVLWVVLLLGLSGVILVAFDRMAASQRRAESATQFTKGVLELNLLAHDLLEGRGPRAAQQWRSRHASLESLLAGLDGPTSAMQEILTGARSEVSDLELFFTQLIEAREVSRQSDNGLARAEYERLLASQLLAKSHSLASLASRLSSLSAADAARTADRARLLMLILAAAATALSAGALAQVAISINRRIRRLREGTQIVGNGNLDYRVDLPGRDEIGVLPAPSTG